MPGFCAKIPGRPAGPAANVDPEPGGARGVPQFLLVKPGCTFDELLDGPLHQRETLRAEMIAKEIEAPLNLADEGLVRVMSCPSP